MPISIKEFNNPKSSWNAQIIAEQIFNLLKDNSDKAYSLLDMQTELKSDYSILSKGIRIAKRKYPDDIEWKWYKLDGRRQLYYHYQKGVRKIVENKGDDKK